MKVRFQAKQTETIKYALFEDEDRLTSWSTGVPDFCRCRPMDLERRLTPRGLTDLSRDLSRYLNRRKCFTMLVRA